MRSYQDLVDMAATNATCRAVTRMVIDGASAKDAMATVIFQLIESIEAEAIRRSVPFEVTCSDPENCPMRSGRSCLAKVS